MQEPVISFTPFEEDVFGDDLNDFDIWEDKGFTISKDFSKIGDWCGDDATVSTISTGISSLENSTTTHECNKVSVGTKKAERRHIYKQTNRLKPVKSNSANQERPSDSSERPERRSNITIPKSMPSITRRPSRRFSNDSFDISNSNERSVRSLSRSHRKGSSVRVDPTGATIENLDSEGDDFTLKRIDGRSSRRLFDRKILSSPTAPTNRRLRTKKSIRNLLVAIDAKLTDEPQGYDGTGEGEKDKSGAIVSKSIHHNSRRSSRMIKNVAKTAEISPRPARARSMNPELHGSRIAATDSKTVLRRISSLVIKGERRQASDSSLVTSGNGQPHRHQRGTRQRVALSPKSESDSGESPSPPAISPGRRLKKGSRRGSLSRSASLRDVRSSKPKRWISKQGKEYNK